MSKRVPERHPDRKYCARGMCASCYQRDYLRRLPSARAARDAYLARRTPEQKAVYAENQRQARQAPARKGADSEVLEKAARYLRACVR